eukprot:184613-Alexandrium_andersonii.AAC.1
MTFRVPGTSCNTETLRLGWGIRQGSAVSPLLWIATLDYALRDLIGSWRARGLGFCLGKQQSAAYPTIE